MTSATTRGSRKPAARQPDQVNSDILDRQPPRNLEAERAVIGSMILLPEVCDDVSLIVKADDFFDPANQTLFQHVLGLYERTGSVDVNLLLDSLKKSDDLAVIGGAAYLAEISRAVPTAAHAEHYARGVHQAAMLRGLIFASTDSLRDAYDVGADPGTVLERAEERIFALQDRKQIGQTCDIREAITQSLDRLDRMKSGQTRGVATGYTDLDDLLGGLQDSELIILAARPSMGKSALALNIAENLGRNGKSVLLVSLEMSSIEIGDRLLCSAAGVKSDKMRSGNLSTEDRGRLLEHAADISRWPICVADRPSQSVAQIAAMARRMKRSGELALVVIDYLQLIEPANPRDPRQEQVAHISRRLKMLAKELALPVLCLSQLNRQTDGGRSNRPQLHHLRESGAIEQDADVVMFVHREEYYQTNDEDRERVAGEADLIVAKQRNGPTGDVKLTWRREYMRFETAVPQNRQREFDQYNAGEF